MLSGASGLLASSALSLECMRYIESPWNYLPWCFVVVNFTNEALSFQLPECFYVIMV